MSQAMRKLTSVIGKTNTVCVFINQLREKVGVMYGNPEVTTGGRALKYYASVRIDIRRVEGLKDSSGQFIGNHTRAKIVKNKVAPPFREAEFDIMFGEGISKMSELIDVGVKLGIVQKSGAWFNYGDIRLGQGRDNAKQFLKDNPEIANDIEGQIRANADKLYASRRPAGKALRPRLRNPPRLQMPRSRWSRLLPAAARANWISWWRTKCPFINAAARSRKKKSAPTRPRPAPAHWMRWPRARCPRHSCMNGCAMVFTEQAAAAAVAEMVELDYVNDDRYAEARAHSLLAARKSRRAAAQNLRQKGLSGAQIEQALESVYAPDADGESPELEAAAALVQSRYMKSWPMAAATLWWPPCSAAALRIRS